MYMSLMFCDLLITACPTKASSSWDIVVQRVDIVVQRMGNKLFFDKRMGCSCLI